MLIFVLLVGVAAALRLAQRVIQTGEDLTFWTLPAAHEGHVFSELQTTDNVILLKRTNATSLSSAIQQWMRLQHVPAMRASNTTTILRNVEAGQVYVAQITVGGQNFEVVIDSGSSDPWLVSDGFACYDPTTGDPLQASDCAFGTPYNSSNSSSYALIPNTNLNVTYADQEIVNGKMAYETMTFGGITVTQQEFGVANSAAWYGDGISSGLVGFAYSTLTSAYNGTNPSADKAGTALQYNPLFVNMYTKQNIAPMFSLVVDRQPSGNGLMGLGGIPAGVAFAPYFASTAIIPAGVNASSGVLIYEYYSIIVDGFAMSKSPATQFNPFNTTNSLKTPLMAGGTQIIVDSGTSLIYAPDDVVANLAEMFTPAATFDDSQQAYTVGCDANAPVFGVSVDNKIFYVNGQDLVVQVSNTQCIMGVQPSLGGLSILGGTWLKNVVAVFDIGAEQMHFAAREFYSLYDASVEENS